MNRYTDLSQLPRLGVPTRRPVQIAPFQAGPQVQPQPNPMPLSPQQPAEPIIVQEAPQPVAPVAAPPAQTSGSSGLFGGKLSGLAEGFNNPNTQMGLGMLMGATPAQGMQLGTAMANSALAAQDRKALLAEKEAEKARANKTLEAAKRMFPDMAEAIDAGLVSPQDAFTMMMGPKPKREIIKGADGRNYFVDSGELVLPNMQAPGPDQGDAFKFESGLRKEYYGNDVVKNYGKIRDSYERVRASAQTDSGPGDLGLIFGYMKMLDPGSVVREGEFATAENAGGYGERMRNIYNRVVSGERLSPEMRAEFVKAAELLYAETARNLEDANAPFLSSAERYGVTPDFILRPEDYSEGGGRGRSGDGTPPPPGVSQEEWQFMTPEERSYFQ